MPLLEVPQGSEVLYTHAPYWHTILTLTPLNLNFTPIRSLAPMSHPTPGLYHHILFSWSGAGLEPGVGFWAGGGGGRSTKEAKATALLAVSSLERHSFLTSGSEVYTQHRHYWHTTVTLTPVRVMAPMLHPPPAPESRVRDPLGTRTSCGGMDPGGGVTHIYIYIYIYIHHTHTTLYILF